MTGVSSSISAIADIGIWFAVFLVLEIIYMAVARRMGWTASHIPSAHGQHAPVVSGGIIFYFACIAGLSFIPASLPVIMIAISTSILAVVSLVDDLHPLGAVLRLNVQAICVAAPVGVLMMSATQPLPPSVATWGAAVATWLFIMGFLNIYNFMDGINGITPFYSLVVVLSLVRSGIGGTAIYPLVGAVAVFAIFNARRRALAFAGDAGAIVLGFTISMLLTFSPSWPSCVIFVSVYLTDAGLTIISRLLHRQNILKSHTTHLYQLLTYRLGIPPLLVSLIYALLQAAINAAYIMYVSSAGAAAPFVIISFVILSAAWVLLHGRLMSRKTISELYLS